MGNMWIKVYFIYIWYDVELSLINVEYFYQIFYCIFCDKRMAYSVYMYMYISDYVYNRFITYIYNEYIHNRILLCLYCFLIFPLFPVIIPFKNTFVRSIFFSMIVNCINFIIFYSMLYFYYYKLLQHVF